MEPGGILSLAIPDKRYIFDRLRGLTTATDWIGAWLQKATRPTPLQILDFLSNVVNHNGDMLALLLFPWVPDGALVTGSVG